MWLGAVILGTATGIVWIRGEGLLDRGAAVVAIEKDHLRSFEREDESESRSQRIAVARQKVQHTRKALSESLATLFKTLISKPKDWDVSPIDALYRYDELSRSYDYNQLPGLAVVLLTSLVLFGIAVRIMGGSAAEFVKAFIPLFLMAALAYILASHRLVKWANLEYPLWALLVGLSISNTIGTPNWLKAGVRTEFYIKTGLVLLGAEVLLNQLVSLGLPGIFISWIVTPIVLIATYVFGQRVLRMESKTLNLVISADMSVCGVSAAIATAAACRAKKEELSLAIGISLAFTVVMMIAMPKFIQLAGIDRAVGAAWIGGTIDATGAVAAAGEILGKDVLPVAATIKMIQNILIGAIAFAVAVYWVTYEERKPDAPRPSLWEIWYRFPKFILGFVAASVVFSTLFSALSGGEYVVKGVTDGYTKTFREWCFCLAFVSIGLETNFRELAGYLKGGKALVLYVCGQTFSLILSLAMCWLMLKVVFPHAIENLTR